MDPFILIFKGLQESVFHKHFAVAKAFVRAFRLENILFVTPLSTCRKFINRLHTPNRRQK